RLQQIAWNLLSNAIKFTDPGGRVSVSTEVDDAEAQLIVLDTGVGIDADFLPHVFDRFRQADGSTSRRHGGLGLGLAIADALAKMHGGRLDAQSEGVGKGSRFSFRLGLVSTEPPDAATVEQKARSLKDLEVLIVEDSEDTLKLLSAMFSKEGARVATATSAAEALDRARSSRPNLVISDIGMPDVDGYEFLQQLKGMPGMKAVPAIAISGYASDDDRQRALGVGYLALVPKPINIDGLFDLIHDLKLPPAKV
ncbi:MAG TPA: ATP-binding protein, partial [Pyrinomonadaceae bacterium]|nr:ATP-binding protein [Pyrinomonadaceae bacterium]